MIDDANEFLAEKLNQQFVRSLTETDAYKRMEYDSASKTFQAMEIPSHFYTKSPVCIISNWWADTPLFRALESRAEFFNFAPSWCELHREVGTWFWDQEIYDYVGKNLHKLRSPDARLYVKAANRKEAGLSANPWKSLIDSAMMMPKANECGSCWPTRRSARTISEPSSSWRRASAVEQRFIVEWQRSEHGCRRAKRCP